MMNTFTKTAVLSATLISVVVVGATTLSARPHKKIDFDKVDTNSDGFLSVEEMTTERSKRFDEMDANADGQLDKDEMKAYREKRRAEHGEQDLGERAQKMFEKIDSDGNGSISPDEYEASVRDRAEMRKERRKDRQTRGYGKFFDRIDADGNGMISKEEMTEKFASRVIERIDTDGDGKISREEAERLQKRFPGHEEH